MPMLRMPVTASVDKFTVPLLAVMPANCSVWVLVD